MASETIAFGEVAALIRQTVQPKDAAGMPYIGLEHVEERTLCLNRYGQAENVTSTKFRFSQGDILFGKLRPYFRKVIRAPFDGVCSTDIWVVRAKADIEQGYLFYWMASQDFVDFATAGSEGTKMPRAKWEHVCRFNRLRVSSEEQRAIAHILGSLDNKIELNRKMNETLEAIAKTIFKSWFVDFDPIPGLGTHKEWQDSPLGNIPRGWRVGKINEGCSRVENGGTPRRDKSSYWNPATVPWLTSGEVRQDIVISTDNKISAEGLVNSSAKLWPKGTTVVALYGATAGQVCLLASEMCANQACCGLVPLPHMQFFNYLYVSSSVQRFEHLARGSAQQNLSQQIVADLQVIIPDTTTLETFEEIIKPLFIRQILNLEQSRTLAAIRDALLPKLLSGEIRVTSTAKRSE
jgi:type I restriction enzyme S subunit